MLFVVPVTAVRHSGKAAKATILGSMIEISQLQKVQAQKTVIDVEQLVVPAGQITAVVGPVGSGKGTLRALLLGQSRPTVGQILLAGIDPLQKTAFSQTVGVMFAEDTLYKRQTALGNLQFHGRLHGLSSARAEAVLAQVGLADQAQVKVEKLPSGLVRRLAFGVAILHQPQVLLLEEPFARCDEPTLTLLSELMRQQAADGRALLILADDTAHLLALCDTIVTLEQGRVAETIHPKDEQPAERPFKVPVRLEGSVMLVNPAEIYFAEVLDGRVYLHTTDGRVPTQFTMTELEGRLSRSGFFRAHRGYLVNLQHVKEVIAYTRSSYSLKLDDTDGTKIPLSKDAARELRDLLDY